MRRMIGGFGLVLVVSLGLVSGCDEGDDSDGAAGESPSSSTSGAAEEPDRPAVRVQFRRVLSAEGDFACPEDEDSPPPAKPANLCGPGPDGPEAPPVERLRLAPAAFVGGVEDAEAARPPGAPDEWAVQIWLDEPASRRLAELTRDLEGTYQRFAMVYGGRVLTAPIVVAAIPYGRLLVSGLDSRLEAERLAATLTGSTGSTG